VAACPMRVLEFKKSDELVQVSNTMQLWVTTGSEHPFPLPTYSRTQPHLAVKFHPAMLNNLEKRVENHEETRPSKSKSELPLVVFTLLGQMAVGMFWATGWIFAPLRRLAPPNIFFLQLVPIVLAGLCLGSGMLVALVHLGTKRNAIRMLNNLKKSWLSKEILYMGLFGSTLLLYLVSGFPILGWLTSLFGFGLIYSMASVYRLRSMPSWNNWRTLAEFLLSAMLLGQFVLVPLLSIEASLTGMPFSDVYGWWPGYFCVALLAGELVFMIQSAEENCVRIHGWRIALILLAMVCVILNPFAPVASQIWLYGLLFLLLCLEEGIGRWLFYRELENRTL